MNKLNNRRSKSAVNIFNFLSLLSLFNLFWCIQITSYFFRSETTNQPLSFQLRFKPSFESQHRRTEPLDKSKVFSFVHISKCAGASLILELQKYLSKEQVFPRRKRGAEFSVHAQNQLIQSKHYNLTSLKSPRHHVFSLFMECKHDKWGRKVTNGTDFPRSGSSIADDEHDFQIWLNHFVNTIYSYSGRSFDLSLSETNDFNCYHPANYQSRALTSTNKVPHHIDFKLDGKPIFEPNVTDAIQTYWDHDWVAISEFYSESKCLLLYRMSKGSTHTSTDSMTKEYLDYRCSCNDENKIPSSLANVQDVKVFHHQGGRRSTLSDLPPDMLSKIEALTRVDMEVYTVALLQFLREIAWLESESELGRRVLCQSALDKFEHELSYLGISITEEYNHAVKGVSGSDLLKNSVNPITDSDNNNTSIFKSSLGPFENLDRIYYINLDKRADKRNFMESWLEPFSKQYSIPYQRVSAMSGDDLCNKILNGGGNIRNCRAKMGLRNSNLHIMDNYNTTGYTLVLEDDFEIKNYTRLLDGVRKVPNDWDVIRFDCWRGMKHKFLDPLIEFPQFEGGYRTVTPRGKKKFCGGTHAVLWREDRLQNLRKVWEQKKLGIDCALADDDIKSYCVQTKIGRLGVFKTDIPKGGGRKKKKKKDKKN
jgi:hypothetical protein